MNLNSIEKHQNKVILAAVAVIIGMLPLLIASNYQKSVAVFVGLNTMLAIGLCLLTGYTGQMSLGHAAFYGIGAYTSGILTTKYKVDPWLAMVVMVIFIGLVAYVLGVPLFRLKGLNLATGTLAFGMLAFIFFQQEIDLTGGPHGLVGIPSLSILGFAFDNDVKYYYLVWVLTLLFIVLSLNIVDSRIGLALRSIHDSEIAAEMLGVNAKKYKVQIFMVSAVYAGIAGSLYAHYVSYVNPPPFGIYVSIMVLVMVVLGGLSNVWGSLFGAVVITALTEVLRGIIPKFTGGASGEYEIVVFGVVLAAVMIFAPDGLVSVMAIPIRRWQQKRDFPAKALEAPTNGPADTSDDSFRDMRVAIEDK